MRETIHPERGKKIKSRGVDFYVLLFCLFLFLAGLLFDVPCSLLLFVRNVFFLLPFPPQYNRWVSVVYAMPVISLSLRSSASHSNSSSSSWQQQQRGRDASSFVTRVSLSHSFISIYIQTRRESCRKSVYDSIIHSAKALFNPFYHQFHLASKLSGFQINETAAVICRYYAGQQQQFATNYFPSFFWAFGFLLLLLSRRLLCAGWLGAIIAHLPFFYNTMPPYLLSFTHSRFEKWSGIGQILVPLRGDPESTVQELMDPFWSSSPFFFVLFRFLVRKKR